jgi:radical SAM protein with 4Fe4S-binding SPASM domain
MWIRAFRVRTIRTYVGKGNSLLYFLRWTSTGMLRRLTPARAWNILLSLVEWKTRRTTVRSRPWAIRIEVSRVCNLKCPSCATASRKFAPGETRLMSLQAFQTVFDNVKKAAYRVTFYVSGEPMTNPRLFEMVRIAHLHNCYTYFSTNFTLMRKDLLEPMFRSGLDRLSACLDGFSQAGFATYRQNGDVERVKEGIRLVQDYKRVHGLTRPILNIFTITFSHVQPEMEQVEHFCREQRVDRLTVRPDQMSFDGSHEFVNPRRAYSKCFWPWVSVTANPDGTVYPCPRRKQSYGNLLEQGIDEIWNGPMYQKTRRFLSGQIAASEAQDLPCVRCSLFGDSAQESARADGRAPLPVLRGMPSAG